MNPLAKHSYTNGFGPPEAAAVYDGYLGRKALIDGYLKALSFSKNTRLARLVESMRYSLRAGGERVRPVLCMEVAGTFGLDPAEVLPSAAAIELLHTGSLVHGSLPVMGGDRRGLIREESSDATVILAGDAFFSEALTLISRRQKASPERLLEAIREFATSSGVCGMVGGQAMTLELDGRVADPETLNEAHNYRTGLLIVASACIGAILGGATAEEKEIVAEYARQLGLCMQISSDILKAGSKSEPADHEKVSFVQVYGLPASRRLADEALGKALEALGGLDRDTRRLAEMAHFAYSRTDHESIV